VLHKSKSAYVRLLSSGGALGAEVVPKVLASKGEIALAQDGSVERAAFDETVSSSLPAAGAVRVVSTLRFARVSRDGADPAARTRWDALRRVLGATEPYGQAPGKDAFADLRIDGMTVQSALAALDSDAAAPAKLENMQAFTALAALIRRDGSGIAAVVARARKDDVGHRYLDALADAGTPDAQRALIALVQDGGTPAKLRAQAARSLARVDRPTGEQVALLHSLVDHPKLEEHGLYGLGTAARRTREAGDVAKAREIAATLASLLGRANTAARRIRVLRAIANSADPSLLAVGLPFLEHEDFGVREAAVYAVRLMNAPEVDGLLAARLAQDPHASVRSAAATAMSARAPTAALAGALTAAALGDRDPHVRNRAIRVMSAWLDDLPQLSAALAEVAEADPEPKLRAQAAGALGRRDSA
jgi:HEAT repeat protein